MPKGCPGEAEHRDGDGPRIDEPRSSQRRPCAELELGDERVHGRPSLVRIASESAEHGVHDATRDLALVGLTRCPFVSKRTGYRQQSWPSNVLPPDTARTKITLTASVRERSVIRSASFHVATAVIAQLLPDDFIELTRTHHAGLGLAVSRDRRLIVAAGAISSVGLGTGIRASVSHGKPAADSREGVPVEVTVGWESHILSNGRIQLGKYELFVAHGYLRGIPGKPECAALSRSGDCSPAAATATALLLRYGEFKMVKW